MSDLYKDAEMVVPTRFQYAIHGPQWQFECNTCHFMGDVWDSKEEATTEMNSHTCRPMSRTSVQYRQYMDWLNIELNIE